jgi:dienelactone hydrolase
MCIKIRLFGSKWLARAVIAATAVTVISLSALYADVVVLKDGFTLEGKVRRETTVVRERLEDAVSIPKPNGFYTVEDGARVIIFNQNQVANAAATDVAKNTDLYFERPFKRLDHFPLPAGIPASATPWDDHWERVLKMDSVTGTEKVTQHLTFISPEFVHIDTKRFEWSPRYITRELDPEEILGLLRDHPEFKTKGASADFNKRFRIYRFLRAAGWADRALVELDSLEKEFPDNRDKIIAARESIKNDLAVRLVDRLELAQKCGQHQWVQSSLAGLPRKEMAESLQQRLRALDSTYETLNKNLTLARRYLFELPPRVRPSPLRGLIGEAATTIADELNVDTADRLESFVSMAQQAEKDGASARLSPEQLMALAVSGWFLGNNVAESKVDTMVRLWHTRQMVREYEKTHETAGRKQIVEGYLKSDAIAFDELAQVIRFLPPPDALETMSLARSAANMGLLPGPASTVYRAVAALERALPAPRAALQVTLASGIRRGANYLVQLPPEYHPGRSYPVLFALHRAGSTPQEILQPWSTLAAQNGYFLVAPEWDQTQRAVYDYSEPEHAAVVDVLRDLRRRFQIDSDRVFLSGYGAGANMAFDVGLSHPDLFAGVLPMSGGPHYFASRYWHNAQYLPFYLIDGDSDAQSATANRKLFEHWMPKGYPALYVQYRGRGQDWFGLELPRCFDWMNRKKRAQAFPELGKPGLNGEEFQSMRPTDAHFYWLSGEGMQSRFINDRRRWKNDTPQATLQATIATGNQINVNAHGFRRVVVWLGLGMIDFEKPAGFFINRQPIRLNRKVVPSLATLLEDFYQRGDRQRLFVAKLTFDL